MFFFWSKQKLIRIVLLKGNFSKNLIQTTAGDNLIVFELMNITEDLCLRFIGESEFELISSGVVHRFGTRPNDFPGMCRVISAITKSVKGLAKSKLQKKNGSAIP